MSVEYNRESPPEEDDRFDENGMFDDDGDYLDRDD